MAEHKGLVDETSDAPHLVPCVCGRPRRRMKTSSGLRKKLVENLARLSVLQDPLKVRHRNLVDVFVTAVS